jgi:hypothetical protein
MSRAPALLPRPLSQAAARFERYRSRRRLRRIPPRLWDLAASLAQRFGVSRTSQVLGLNYSRLKELAARAPSEPPGGTPRPQFVEWLPQAGSAPSECVVEFERPDGAKARIRLQGGAAPDLTGLGRLFLGLPS